MSTTPQQPSYDPTSSPAAGNAEQNSVATSAHQDGPTAPSTHSAHTPNGGGNDQKPTSARNVEASGFFKALFDLNFDTFVTIKFTKVVYILLILSTLVSFFVGWLIPAFGLMASGEDYGVVLGVLWLLVGWIAPVITLVLYRIGLEFFVATIRTSQNTTIIRDQLLHKN